MITLISGATRLNGRVYVPSDGPFDAPPDVEARLVAAGVARAAVTGAETPTHAPDGAGGLEYAPAGENAPAGAVANASATLDREALSGLTNAQLKELAERFGLDASTMRKKADYVEAILRAQSVGREEAEEEGDAPPELGAADIVT